MRRVEGSRERDGSLWYTFVHLDGLGPLRCKGIRQTDGENVGSLVCGRRCAEATAQEVQKRASGGSLDIASDLIFCITAAYILLVGFTEAYILTGDGSILFSFPFFLL